jgi:CDP-glucose 4,6-dehydratase
MIEGAAEDIASTFDINIRGTWTVLEACRRAGSLQGIVCASSNHVYGSSRSMLTEDSPLSQLDAYGASKACADIVARSFARNFGLPVVAARNVNSFGPGDFHASHIVTGSILSLLGGEAPVIRSDGRPTKAYLHARDTMEAYMLLAEHAKEAGVRGEAFNITPDSPISAFDLVRSIIKVSGRPDLSPVVLGSDRSQQGYYEHLSGEKLKQRLGWTPRMTLEEGLLDAYRWYAEHGSAWMEREVHA